jgi:hypothetical protein
MKHSAPQVGRFERYVLLDHKARWRSDASCIGVGLAWCVFRSFYSSVPDAQLVKELGVILTAGVIYSTVSYCETSERKKPFPAGFAISRRSLLRQAYLSFAAIFVLSVPPVGAALIDERLKQTLKAPLTPAKLDRAASLVTSAQKLSIRLNPWTVAQLGNQVLQVSTEQSHLSSNALNASAAFAGYATFAANRAPLRGEVIRMTGHGVEGDKIFIGPQVKDDFALLIGSPAIYAPGEEVASIVPPVKRVIIRVRSQNGLMWFDEVHERHITYENARIGYFGGSIRLEDVQFINCTFVIIVADETGKANATRFLAAVMTGKPVYLELVGDGVVPVHGDYLGHGWIGL